MLELGWSCQPARWAWLIGGLGGRMLGSGIYPLACICTDTKKFDDKPKLDKGFSSVLDSTKSFLAFS